MHTPWGDIAVADSHVHFFSHRFFALLGAHGSTLGVPEDITAKIGWQAPPSEAERLAAQWNQELDRYGVERAAIISSTPGDEDSVAAAVRAYPKRFYGYFMLNAAAPDSAERAKRALDNGLLQGICLFPAMHRYSIHDERVIPILDLAAARPGTVVFVHCGVLTVGIRKKLGLLSPFDMRFSNPIDVHAIALRYPQLPFVIPHFGAGYFREALMLCDLCPNVYLDTSSSNSWTRYSGENLETVFRRALDVVGAGRLLFGTDSSFFPRGWNADVFHTQVRLLSSIGIAESDARAVFGENLRRLMSRAGDQRPLKH